MSKVKFRAYSEKDGMEYFDDLYWFEENGVHEIIDGIGQGHYRKYNITWSIGPKDKNGKEIYGGDILSYPRHKGYYLIEWKCNDSDCGFTCERNKPSYNYMLPRVWDRMKIIGNIYENPELLGKEK